MVRRDYSDYLQDIIKAIDEIRDFIRGQNSESFETDRKTINAVVRSLEVIGEAAKKIPFSLKRKNPAIPWKKMAGMRDKLIHEYFGIDVGMVWKVAKEDIPKLKPMISKVVKISQGYLRFKTGRKSGK